VSLVLDILTVLLFAGGGALIFVGGLGALRMPDVYTRIHPAGLTDTMGTILVLGGCLLQSGFTLPSVKLGAILVFLLLTTPTATYALANAARLANVAPVRATHRREDVQP
jgi:multicomponent Na+:H+ antiporter subunit G